MAKSEPRKILEREDVENLREMIWRGKNETYQDGWKHYARRAFDKAVIIPEGRKEEFYQGMQDARMFAKALYKKTAKLSAEQGEEDRKKPIKQIDVWKPKEKWNTKGWADNEMSRFLKTSGMTNKELAERIGITPAAVSHIVTGRGKLSEKTKTRLLRLIKEWEKEKTAT